MNRFGYLRVAAVVPELKVADVSFNTDVIKGQIVEAVANNSNIIVFPELCITGYSCSDLFYQELLVKSARQALDKIASMVYDTLVIVGLPLIINGKLYNCAAALNNYKVIGFVPKSYLPNRGEFYENRWFTPAEYSVNDQLFGTDLIFKHEQAKIGIEICEDLWAPIPPSSHLAIAGANVLINLSASDEVLGKAEYRRELVKQQSARCSAAYVYVCAGPNESTTDVVYAGHSIVAENGTMLAESRRFEFESQIIYADIDVQKLEFERLRNSSFSFSRQSFAPRMIDFVSSSLSTYHIKYFPLAKTPFIPHNHKKRDQVCEEIFNIQSTALAKRLRHTGINKACIALSGGLDSTLALLATVKTFKILGLPLSNIVTIGMPGPGSTNRTQNNAAKLAKLLGVSFKSINICKAVKQHLEDISYDIKKKPTAVYENAQARERTQILFDVANDVDALAIGTGDLSEAALGWCTYGGDHLSMYNVNCGIPKTLVKFIVDYVAREQCQAPVKKVLRDICNTIISPELLAPKRGKITQSTESLVGPYVLNDFFLFYTIRYHFTPEKIATLACKAFKSDFTVDEILHWLKNFYKRFFAAQFKRSAMPDGPKVGSVTLSPRGDWRMPSDASVQLWLKNIETIDVTGCLGPYHEHYKSQ